MAGSTKTTVTLVAPVHGAVIGIEVQSGQRVLPGRVLLVLESMKMEVPLEAPAQGVVRSIAVVLGDVVPAGAALISFEPGDADTALLCPATPPAGAPGSADLEVDDVIDPAETRAWLQRVLASTDGLTLPLRRAYIDPW